ncbi:MAG TPA: bifunctional 4-hydroxy-2-oxoglutarate aldolase/2-dehydro-3-deoxy-phosphogluconate aldolase [Acidimicrobiia bacterium]|nr:bifunctional 4-hydroxy-2-oxoglutarate aldolase/2-dehydro-3-deoxy-phosphogluconate aldolase [Acidimicrobiia bacterium]
MILPSPILDEKVIPVARGLDTTTAPRLVSALRAGGISSIEITVEGGRGFEAIESVADQGALIGAGTVLTIEQAQRARAAGAVFIVSPHLDPGLVQWGTAEGVPVIPGAFTPTEVHTAWRLGPPAVKVFPASLGGPGYIRALLAPFPDLALIPTGGVDATNIADFIAAGARAVGVGAWLTGTDDSALVTQRARMLLDQVV